MRALSFLLRLRSGSVRCPVRRSGGSGHRGGFKYAAHTPAAVCGWRPEQNLAAVVPESVAVHVYVFVGLCVFGFFCFFCCGTGDVCVFFCVKF